MNLELYMHGFAGEDLAYGANTCKTSWPGPRAPREKLKDGRNIVEFTELLFVCVCCKAGLCSVRPSVSGLMLADLENPLRECEGTP